MSPNMDVFFIIDYIYCISRKKARMTMQFCIRIQIILSSGQSIAIRKFYITLCLYLYNVLPIQPGTVTALCRESASSQLLVAPILLYARFPYMCQQDVQQRQMPHDVWTPMITSNTSLRNKSQRARNKIAHVELLQGLARACEAAICSDCDLQKPIMQNTKRISVFRKKENLKTKNLTT